MVPASGLEVRNHDGAVVCAVAAFIGNKDVGMGVVVHVGDGNPARMGA
jgi:hypothetical protein